MTTIDTTVEIPNLSYIWNKIIEEYSLEEITPGENSRSYGAIRAAWDSFTQRGITLRISKKGNRYISCFTGDERCGVIAVTWSEIRITKAVSDELLQQFFVEEEDDVIEGVLPIEYVIECDHNRSKQVPAPNAVPAPNVEDKGKFFVCPDYPKLRMWKTVCSRRMTQEDYQEVLRAHKLEEPDNGPVFEFTSKAGNEFCARMVLKNDKLEFEFVNNL